MEKIPSEFRRHPILGQFITTPRPGKQIKIKTPSLCPGKPLASLSGKVNPWIEKPLLSV